MAKCEMQFEKLLSLADGLYDEGYQGLRYLPNGARTAIRLAGKVYQEIGHEIRRQNFSVMNGRIFVPLKWKLTLVAKCASEELIFRLRENLPKLHLFLTDVNSIFSIRNSTMSNETRYLGYLGISLTFVMATTCFC